MEESSGKASKPASVQGLFIPDNNLRLAAISSTTTGPALFPQSLRI